MLPLLIGNPIYRQTNLGAKHPLSIPRVSTALELIEALGWLDPARYLESRPASDAELARFHAPDYIDAVRRTEQSQQVSEADAQRYNIGRGGNAIHPAMFRRPATNCGASLMAVRHLMQAGQGIVHSPGGGTHHARAAKASGFCYFNDPVLAILELLDQGLDRVAYVDLDVHHGDGVEEAFRDEPRVFFASIHEAGRWPFTGVAHERGIGNLHNYPVPPGMNDDEFTLLVEEGVLPALQAFRPEALIIQAGADALLEDPLAKQALGNGSLWRAVDLLRPMAPRLLVLGGGGYNPWSVARCWAGIWGRLNGEKMPEILPPAAQGLLRRISWNHSTGRNPPPAWFETLADPWRGGPIRDSVRSLVQHSLAA